MLIATCGCSTSHSWYAFIIAPYALAFVGRVAVWAWMNCSTEARLNRTQPDAKWMAVNCPDNSHLITDWVVTRNMFANSFLVNQPPLVGRVRSNSLSG